MESGWTMQWEHQGSSGSDARKDCARTGALLRRAREPYPRERPRRAKLSVFLAGGPLQKSMRTNVVTVALRETQPCEPDRDLTIGLQVSWSKLSRIRVLLLALESALPPHPGQTTD
jgi:hypothetical protein